MHRDLDEKRKAVHHDETIAVSDRGVTFNIAGIVCCFELLTGTEFFHPIPFGKTVIFTNIQPGFPKTLLAYKRVFIPSGIN